MLYVLDYPLSAEAKKGSELTEQELRMAELSAELGDGIMGHLAKLMIERNKSDVAKSVAAQRSTNAPA
ncbi:MAG: hypothetical protein AAB964_01700 [Patescibacteria group bacterium]